MKSTRDEDDGVLALMMGCHSGKGCYYCSRRLSLLQTAAKIVEFRVKSGATKVTLREQLCSR